jgi:hypothetical protein
MNKKQLQRTLKHDPWSEIALPIVQDFVRELQAQAPPGAHDSPAAYEALGQNLTAGVVQIWRLKGVMSIAKAAIGK